MSLPLSVVVPVYNEEKHIEPLLENIRVHTADLPLEVLVIYDFEEDSTLPVVSRIRGDFPFSIRLVRNRYGRGALNAIRTGLEEGSGEAAVVLMADLSDDLSVLKRMHELIRDGYDLVCGSRYMKGGAQIGGPLIKKTMSRLAGVSLHHLTGIPTLDVTNSFKMYSRRLLDHVNVESRGGFEIGMEIAVKAFLEGFRITEVPSVWRDREHGKSRFRTAAWLPRYLKWYFHAFRVYRLRAS